MLGDLNVSTRYAKYGIITPTLHKIGLYSESALNLIAGIGSVESGYRTRIQVDGPALGFWQVEPETERDCWVNFLAFREGLAQSLKDLVYPHAPGPALLGTNDQYDAAICRVILLRCPQALPQPYDAVGMCRYWKAHYNTAGGAGSVNAARIALFQQAIEA